MKKSGILSQSVMRRLKRHRLAFGALGALAAMGMAGAIAVMPDNANTTLPVSTVIEHLALPDRRPLEATGGFFREERINKGDTTGALLARLGIQDAEASLFIRTSPRTQAIQRQLVPGKVVVASTSETGELNHLIFPLNGKDAVIVVERTPTGFVATEQPLRYETHTTVKSAEIQSSLFAATDANDIPDSIATQLAEIFGGDIDFHRDLRKGDRFSVSFEMQYLRGQPARTGRVLAAEFVNGGKVLRAVYFEQHGKGAYFTPDGRSLRKAFLRSPLEFSRVTSGFAMRLHPILQQWREHKGVDYGAPIGTRVRATADGVVEFIGRQGGYGNLVILRHGGNYSTAYGHLSGFARGLHRGSRIVQGDTLGYVGRTGLASGPHLHYELRIGNRPVNPLSISLPVAMPLDAAQMSLFKASTDSQLDRLNLAREFKIASAVR